MPSPTRAVKQRRFHRKSKRGCAECKRRHIKCDEGRPLCANCRISHRPCVYVDPPPEPSVAASSPADALLTLSAPSPSSTQGHSPQHSAAATSPGHGTALDVPVTTVEIPTALPLATSSSSWFSVPLTPSPSQQGWTTPAPIPYAPSLASEDDLAYTFEDFALFHHFQTSNMEWMMVTDAFKPMFDLQMTLALTTPYVMDQILSISASHLAATCGSPSKEDAYRTRASELQNRALRSFNKIMFRQQQQQEEQERREQEQKQQQQLGLADQPEPQRPATDPEYDIVAHFLFASLVGRSILTERLSSDRHDFNLFIAGLVESMQLLRGSRVVGGSAWQILLTSPQIGSFLKAIIDPGLIADHLSERHPGLMTICDMLSRSRLPSNEIEECDKAREGLAYIVDRLGTWGASIMSSWPSVAPPEFMGLVLRRVPEALVIMAHYAVLMHQFRNWWVFGDAGEYMLRNIVTHLDDEWQQWLPSMPQASEDEVMT